ncbi:fimbrial protein [Escherichia marmotae]|uniref:fimbrial protein n=1 Tax=Escherichia marmotae TaxID=1499973 RepID=UPI002ABCF3E7|nr:fimbrial protein [Escherichia coli]MDZ3930195.1 fimbrial protein [Escherichia marmotae]MEC9870335.1 fimbrial protein [Escherichia marmotae]
MKKLILGSAILAVLGVASSAMAAPNTGTVNFTGSVSTATCEFSLQNSSGGNITEVNLGSLSSTSKDNGTPFTFKLVPSDNACISKTSANVSWSSPTLGIGGINNTITTGGTNAYVRLAATNATQKNNDSFVKQGQTSFDYTATDGKISSFDYAAVLMKPASGNVTAGLFQGSASYVVTYK